VAPIDRIEEDSRVGAGHRRKEVSKVQ